jgi:hypothetical protein
MKAYFFLLLGAGLVSSLKAQIPQQAAAPKVPAGTAWLVLPLDPAASAKAEPSEKDADWGRVHGLNPDQTAWKSRANGQGFQHSMGISVSQAKALIPVLSGFFPKPGERLWLVSNQSHYGPFGSEFANVRGDFAVPPLAGDSLCLIWESASPEAPTAHLSHLWYESPTDKSGFGSSGPCNIDVECVSPNPLKDALVLMLSPSGARRCTGTLLNNTAQDGSPLVLTARHCNTTADAIFVFDYYSPSCGGPDATLLRSIQGGSRLASNPNADAELWKLDRSPLPQWKAFWAGWDRADSLPGAGYYGLHHPSGDVLKHSIAETNGLGRSSYLGAVSGTGSYVRVNNWTSGTTEPGSSGSPLIRMGTHAVVGQLRGGYAACSNNLEDYYGGLFASWNHSDTAQSLGYWLDPAQNGNAFLAGGYYPRPAFNLDFEVLMPEDRPYCPGQAIWAGLVRWGQNSPDSLRLELRHGQGTQTWWILESLGFSDTLWIDIKDRLAGQQGSDSVELELKLPGNLTDQQPGDNRRKGRIRVQTGPVNILQYSHAELKKSELRIQTAQGELVWKRRSSDSLSNSSADTLCLGIACLNVSFPDWHENSPGILGAEIVLSGGGQVQVWNAEQGWSDKNFCQPLPGSEQQPFVFPNPSAGAGYFYLPGSYVGGSIGVFDALGRLCGSFEALPGTYTEIPEFRLESGLYSLQPLQGGAGIKWLLH